MIADGDFSDHSSPSTEDGAICCTVCWSSMYYLEMKSIGSRGQVFSGGVVCKNQKQHHWLCSDPDDNTIVTVEYCSRKCAKKKGLEKEYDKYLDGRKLSSTEEGALIATMQDALGEFE